ncbi:transcription initiation factor TFIID subunit 12-like isoform X2 [Actinia tenebrosa]|uniref:Transcription initiation factor TFIID subunit 12 n=1 Tax=Actinia tenebrosa TaxID=6105 RepID=A0A6P8IMM3_ACTTE|nr:transcription initiation factor TFIID subunit 12-like isoform X2 [Actinia tenebrosa]
MASQQPGIPVTSGSFMQRKSVEEMLQEVSKRIQNFGPGPITPEQAQELEKLQLIYAKLLKSQGEVIVTTQNPASNLAQASMAGQKIPGAIQQAAATQQTVQRIVPAVASNQGARPAVPGNLPVTTTVTILPQGSTIPTTIQVSSSTNLTAEQIQQIQAQVLSHAQAHGQPHTVQITSPVTVGGTSAAVTQQQQVAQGQVKVVTPATGQTHLAPGQRVVTGSPTPVGVTPAGIKSTQVGTQPGVKIVTQPGTTQAVPIQRLAPNKIQSSAAISTTQPNTSGVIPNIAPSSTVSVPKSLVSHGGITNRVETSSPQPQQPLTKRRIQELLHEIDPQEQMDDDVEDLLLQIADDFIENVVNASCQIAKHRKSNTLEVKDVQLHLERCWNMWIPGFGADELRPYKKAATTEAHKQRLALIRKSLKK